ncbi:MAG: hypothetical protein ACK4Q5_09605 [Saprospiraceae bacterium]
MTIQLEITNPSDAELIMSLVRRLNISFKPLNSAPSASGIEREKAIERIRNFKPTQSSSFGDALDWQRRERTDRSLPFNENR